jgi:GH25 family lysozyme M1 (1,4-beta-N-acetylmuramidase)
MPLGVDVSSWQHPPKSSSDINWAQVAASGQQFAIVKATEGDYYTNPFLGSDLSAAHAAGLVVGAYHFAIPSLSAITQADDFANAIRTMPMPHLPPVLDIESTGDPADDDMSVTDTVNWTSAFLQRVAADTGTTPMIYVSPSFWQNRFGNSTAFGQYPLWEANYQVSSPAPIGAWGSNWTLWQYTDCASVSGIAGCVDQSKFNTSTGRDLSNLTAPIGNVDSAQLAATGVLSVWGWAFDPDTPTASTYVDVYVDGKNNRLVAAGSRPDLASAYPSAGGSHGWGLSTQVAPGTHSVCLYAIDTSVPNLHTDLGCRSLTLTPNLPVGWFDSARVGSDGTLTVAGWAFDPDTPTAASHVDAYVDGRFGQSITANGSRPDIGNAFPAAGSNHGFTATTQVAPGTHSVCLYAIDTYFPNLHTDLGCRSVG